VGVWQEGVAATEGLDVAKSAVRRDRWTRDDVGAEVGEAAARTHENDRPADVSTFPDDLDVVPGAREGVAALAEDHEVVFVTSRPPDSREGTRAWLDSEGFPYDDLRMPDRKEPEPVVDDHLWNVQKFTGYGDHPTDPDLDARPAVLFDRPWSTRHVDVTDHGTTGAVRVEAEDSAERWRKTVAAVDGLLRGEDVETVRAAASADGVVDAVAARTGEDPAGAGGEDGAEREARD
jgi:hypothetical protein